MAFDKTKPGGDDDLGLGDDLLRTHWTALEAGIDAEHYFATGGSQTGRHKFGIGDTATRNALTPQHGMIWFNTDAYTSHVVVQVYQTNAWVNVDVLQTNIFRTDAQTRSTVPQYADWLSVAIGGSNPNYTLACDMATSPRKYATLTQNVTLSNPTNDSLAGTSATDVMFDLIQDGTGGRTVAFGSNYYSANGLRPVITTTPNSRTRLYISSTQNGKYLVSSAPDMKAIT